MARPDSASPANQTLRRPMLAILATLLALHVGLAWLARPPGILTGQDDTEYIALGQALRQGTYRELWRIDAPIHSQYPPGYPSLLAGWGPLVGDSFRGLVVLGVILSAASLALAHGVLRRRLGADIALASVAILAVNVHLIVAGSSVLSETPYLFWSVACLYFLVRAEDREREPPATIPARARSIDGWMLAAGAAALAAALTRTAGATLLGALGLYWLLARRWKPAALFGLASVVVFGSWLVWTMLAPEQVVRHSYVADLAAGLGSQGSLPNILRRGGASALWYGQRIPFYLAAPSVGGTIIDNVLLVTVLGTLMLAGLPAFFRRWQVAALYLLAYALLLVAWTWRIERFVVPVLVLLVPLALAGAAALSNRWRPALTRPVLLVLVVLLGGGGAAQSIHLVRDRAGCHQNENMPSEACITSAQASYFAALRFIRSNLPQDAVILAVKSGALYYYTGRRSITVGGALSQRPDGFTSFARNRGAQYVLLSSVDAREPGTLPELLQANCDQLELIESFTPQTLLFGLSPQPVVPTEPSSESAGCAAIAAYRAQSSSRR